MDKFGKDNLLTEALEEYGTDLTKLAEEGKLDPVIGREKEIELVIQILCKRRKNNPCLIGDPGVGKTMIAEGLAQRIVNASVPPSFTAKKIFSIDMASLISGAVLQGMFEGRLLKVIDEVKQSKGVIILFIDELHTLVGAGGRALDAANILKPSLARGELKCIGATTIHEYRKYIEKDPALKRRFQIIDVPEPTIDEAIQILKGLSHKYEDHHNVRYSDDALEAAVHLSKQYISDRFLPDKAIDLIDESGSRVRLRKTKEQIPLLVSENDIRQVVSSWTGIPIETISSKESIKLLNMEKSLRQSIIGQQEAVEAVSRVIRRARVGIRDPSRPIASFLFTGPTGVGKTEIAKVVASEYFGSKEKGMVRIDMSEYMEHTVSRLIGSPPGYVGHDEGGQLTEAIYRHPHRLVLFDEIEKAHRDVFNVFLQILDDGRLTDGKGRTVDFRNTIIIMTSNIGGGVEMKNESRHSYEKRVANELKRSFRPEFLGRIDDVIVFKRLGKGEMGELLDKMLKLVSERLINEKKIRLKFTDKVKCKLIEEGYSYSYGARPMRRAITRLVEDGLADSILKGEVKEGHNVMVDLDWRGNIFFTRFKPPPTPPPPPPGKKKPKKITPPPWEKKPKKIINN